MKSLRLIVAVILGFVLGALLHPMSTKANDGSGIIYVKKATLNGSTLGTGTHVVGFSCTGSGSETECYFATE
jgi:hypothetical protein